MQKPQHAYEGNLLRGVGVFGSTAVDAVLRILFHVEERKLVEHPGERTDRHEVPVFAKKSHRELKEGTTA